MGRPCLLSKNVYTLIYVSSAERASIQKATMFCLQKKHIVSVQKFSKKNIIHPLGGICTQTFPFHRSYITCQFFPHFFAFCHFLAPLLLFSLPAKPRKLPSPPQFSVCRKHFSFSSPFPLIGAFVFCHERWDIVNRPTIAICSFLTGQQI